MQLGAIFPQTEIGADPVAVRDFAQAAEGMGYEHLLVFDHVLGADASKRESWERPYSHTSMEPFVLFGYLAAFTETIQMTTGILRPQRQTALVAKQAAAVDVLTGGRLRLGLGENFENFPHLYVPRALCFVWILGRLHRDHPDDHRNSYLAPTPDGVGSQAGRGGRRADRRQAAAGSGHRLERCRIRGSPTGGVGAKSR